MPREIPLVQGTAEAFGKFLECWTWPSGWVQYLFHCPGCQSTHIYTTSTPKSEPNHPVWSFNGDPERPTFEPSLLVSKSDPARTCHLFVVEGHIRYCNDSHHELAGKTVPMVPFS